MTMLQFSGILVKLSVRHTPRVPFWFVTKQLVAANSTIPNLNPELEQNKISKKKVIPGKENTKKNNGQVPQIINVRDLFDKHKTVDQLLSSVNVTEMSPEHCLEIISKLSDLVNQNKIKITQLNSNPRYKKLCDRLSSMNRKQNSEPKLIGTSERKEYYSSIPYHPQKIGFIFDIDQIQKIVEQPYVSTTQATKIISKLAFHKSRVLPVLQSLARHIAKSNQKIDVKLASDILYNISTLNFYDEDLINKIATDILIDIPKTKVKHSSAIGSILKSIGLLRYRNEKLMIQLTTWMLKNYKTVKPQVISSFLVTLSIVGCSPVNEPELFQNFVQNLNETDTFEAAEWLDIVWALAIINKAQETHVLSVINTQFMRKLADTTVMSESKKRKLLNLNAAANLIFKINTDETLKENPYILDVTLARSKEQQDFVKRIISALYTLLPRAGCLKTNVNTGMGFLIDAEYYVDKNFNPIPEIEIESKRKEAIRLAIIPQSYHDFCRGEEKIIGLLDFQCELLKLSGYHIVPIPYTEFLFDQTVVERVKYLRDKIKSSENKFPV